MYILKVIVLIVNISIHTRRERIKPHSSHLLNLNFVYLKKYKNEAISGYTVFF